MNLAVTRNSHPLTSAQAGLIRAELKTILASDSFVSSKRCQDFLEFVVQRALAGDYDSLTERFLGVELFGRAIDYETATDSIVRVRASDVRRRLVQYYSSTRSASPARIQLIPGGYVPDFHWQPDENESGSTSGIVGGVELRQVGVESAAEDSVAGSGRVPEVGVKVRRRATLWISIGIAFILMMVALYLPFPHLRPSNFDLFWKPVLDAPSAPVLSLPTSNTFQIALDAPQYPGESGLNGPVVLKSDDLVAFHNWHVSLPVVQATLSVALALERKGRGSLIRMGTELRGDELRGHPVIAIGSFSNPWTQQNVSGLRFTFDRGASDREMPHIRDSFNPQRSWSLVHTYPEAQTKDYAIVTRTFDRVTGEPFVSLAGLNSFGNQIAGEFVSQDASWDELASRAPRGWQKMNLQVVLETNIVGTTPSAPRIVDVYFWK